jgi:hypothetical protein
MPWYTLRLRELLPEGVSPDRPGEHRDRWLSEIAAGRRMMFRGSLERGLSREVLFVAGALDTAAGILMMLPLLEADAWDGWGDLRFTTVFEMLQMSELPSAPPHVALRIHWSRLRAAVSFDLRRPKAGDPAHSLKPLVDKVRGYLADLEREVQVVSDRETGVQALMEELHDGGLPIPMRFFSGRLVDAVGRHTDRVRRHYLPLAEGLHWDCVAAQRSGASLARRRGEHDRLAAGRGIRERGKFRYHLATWVLRQSGLSRMAIWLFLHHIDPDGLQTSTGAAETEQWSAEAVKEVDNHIAYWTGPAGSKGNPPAVHLGHIETELREWLRPSVR